MESNKKIITPSRRDFIAKCGAGMAGILASGDISAAICKNLMAARNTEFCNEDKETIESEVEYLGCSGSQYIDTGFKANTVTTRFEGEITPISGSGARGAFGSRNIPGAYYASCNVFLNPSSSYSSFRLDWCFGHANVGTECRVSNGKKTNISITRGECWVNDQHFVLSRDLTPSDSVNQSSSFLIGTFNNVASPYTGMLGLIGKARIYSNDTLIYDLHPARIRNEEGEKEGVMFDAISKRIFRNAGSGTFTIGPDVG